MTADHKFNRIYLFISLALFCIPQVIRAQPTPVNVVFTESPGGVLQETVSGNPIGNWVLGGTSPEQWLDTGALGDINPPLGEINPPNGAALGWYEPGSTASFNIINSTSAFSDDPFFNSPIPPAPDSGVIPYSVSGAQVVTASGPVPANLTFIDLGDVAAPAPDTTSTLALSLLACLSLVIMRRYRATPAATV